MSEGTEPVLNGQFFRPRSMTAVVESGLSLIAKMVAMVLLSHWSEKRPRPYPSIATIAREGSMSDRSVRRALRELEEAGAIVTCRAEGQSSRYAIDGLLRLRAHDPGHTDRGDGDAHDDATPVTVTAHPGHTDRPPRSHSPGTPVSMAAEMTHGNDPREVAHGSDPLARDGSRRARDGRARSPMHEGVDTRAPVTPVAPSKEPVDAAPHDPPMAKTNDPHDITDAFLNGTHRTRAPRRARPNTPAAAPAPDAPAAPVYRRAGPGLAVLDRPRKQAQYVIEVLEAGKMHRRRRVDVDPAPAAVATPRAPVSAKRREPVRPRYEP